MTRRIERTLSGEQFYSRNLVLEKEIPQWKRKKERKKKKRRKKGPTTSELRTAFVPSRISAATTKNDE
jgi:hypothetical protein